MPPSSNSELFCFAINNTLEAVHNENDNVCVIGDFNFPSIDWTDNYNMSTLGSGGGNLFRNTMLEFGHTQINDVISAGNILDLVFTKITEMISHISESPCIFPTDHAVLNFSLFMSKPRNKIKERLVYNNKHAQLDVLRSKIADAGLCAVIGNTTDINEAWGEWLGLLEQFMSATIPRVKVKANRSHAWVDSKVRHLSHIKMTAWRRAKRSAKSNDWTN